MVPHETPGSIPDLPTKCQKHVNKSSGAPLNHAGGSPKLPRGLPSITKKLKNGNSSVNLLTRPPPAPFFFLDHSWQEGNLRPAGCKMTDQPVIGPVIRRKNVFH